MANGKTEAKLNLLLGGYMQRATKAHDARVATWTAATATAVQGESFAALYQQESVALPRRLTALQRDVAAAVAVETTLQARFAAATQALEQTVTAQQAVAAQAAAVAAYKSYFTPATQIAH